MQQDKIQEERLSFKSHELLSRLVKINKGTICDLGNLSIEKQIKLFRQHKIVIGVHGNNLSGIMWMQPGSYVFEIIPQKKNIKFMIIIVCQYV